MAMWWALACMVFSAASDLLFKFYTRKPRSIGYFVAIVGVAWTPIAALFIHGMPQDWGATLLYGIIAGVFSVGGNLLMLDAMHSLDAGVCSTIYRLNLVPAALGAALLLGEAVSVQQWFGVAAACLAILFFWPKPEGKARKLAVTAFVMMLLASLMRAGLGLTYKYGFSHGADRDIVVAMGGLFWMLGGVGYALWRERVHAPETEPHAVRKLWGYGLWDGCLVAGITLSLAKALSIGQAAQVLTVTQMSFLLTALCGVILLKESLSKRKIAAILCGVIAVLLMTL